MQMRVSLGWPVTPAVKAILIGSGAAWLAEVLIDRWLEFKPFLDHMALTPERVWPGLEVWQLATWFWLHSPTDPLHIIFNLLFLWMFGGNLEQSWGTRAFVKFYLICGFFSGLVVLVSGLLFAPKAPVVGASGAIYGLVAAWAITFPNRVIYLFGVFPVKGKYFALFPIVWALLDFLVRAEGVSHAAHLGGLATGAALVTGYWRPGKLYRQLRYVWLRRKLKVIEGQKGRRPPPPSGGYWN